MSSTLSRRYAKALLDLASESQAVVKIGCELSALGSALDESPELASTLFTPTVDTEAKRNITAAVLDKLEASETMRNFVGLLVVKGRFNAFREIQAEYTRLANEATGKLRAKLRTAVPLRKDISQRIVDALEKATNKDIELEVTVDPDLLGGIVADVGGVIYDASVSTQLRALRDGVKL